MQRPKFPELCQPPPGPPCECLSLSDIRVWKELNLSHIAFVYIRFKLNQIKASYFFKYRAKKALKGPDF